MQTPNARCWLLDARVCRRACSLALHLSLGHKDICGVEHGLRSALQVFTHEYASQPDFFERFVTGITSQPCQE